MAENHHLDPEPPLVRDLSRWAAAVLLAATIVGFYWKLVLTNQYTWLGGQDTANQVLPWFQFQAGEWHLGHIPLWDPNSYGGQPLLGQAQPGVAYPLNWLLFAMPLRGGWMKQIYLHWYFVVIHLMAAWFAYKLCRELGCRRAASVLGGTVFSLSGWLGSTEWPQMINGAVWAPLVYLYLLRVWRGRQPWLNAVLAGFFLGMAWLSGHHQIPIFISLSCGGAWLWMLAGKLRTGWRRWAGAFFIFWVLAVSTAAVQILPAEEYGRQSVRWVGAPEPLGWDQKVPYSVHAEYGLQPVSLLGVLFPGWAIHSEPFLGAATFTLALLGVACAWQRWETRLFSAIALGGVLFSLSSFDVLHGVIYSLVPLVDKARSPSMSIFLLGLAGSVLAAIGLDALADGLGGVWLRRAAWTALGLGAAVFAVRFAVIIAQRPAMPGEQRDLMTGLAALLLALWLHAVRGRQMSWRAAAMCVLGLFLVEVTGMNNFHFPHIDDKVGMATLSALSGNSDIARFLRQRPGLRRVDIDSSAIAYNFGDWYGLPQSGGYLASLTRNVRDLGSNEFAVKRLMGIAYAVAKEPTDFHKTEVFTGQSGLKVYENRDVMPRAFAVHQVDTLAEPARALETLNRIAPEMEKRAFVYGTAPPVAACAAPDEVYVRTYTPNRVELAAKLGCRGLVVLADTYFSGWKARVDGRDAALYEVDGLVRGVVVDAGAHRVEFVYRPLSVMTGGAASLASLLLAGACLALSKRRR